MKLKNASKDFVADLRQGDIILLISTDNAVDFLYNTDSTLEDMMSRQFEQLVEVLSFLDEEKQKSASFLVGYVTKTKKILIISDRETQLNFKSQ